jgi:hypothetical protein
MKSAYSAEDVLADLGDKVVAGFAMAVQGSRRDLTEYRRLYPAWVTDHTERGLANWIHDRLWSHLRRVLEALPDCVFDNDEPERHFRVGARYHFRAKRHDESGSVRTYPTQGALDFMEQELALDGMEEVRLLIGYVRDKELRTIGEAVVSLRDSTDNLIWIEPLDEPEEGTAVVPLTPSVPDSPKLPTVVTDLGDDENTAGSDAP